MPTAIDSTVAVEKELRNLTDLPVPVNRWNIEIGEDATGDMAVWVWAVVDDADLNRNVRNGLRERIDRAVRRVVPDASWVYVRFRAASEE